MSPWLAWLEFVTYAGSRTLGDMKPEERELILQRVFSRLREWLSELPSQVEGKAPADSEMHLLSAAFERFRVDAARAFANER